MNRRCLLLLLACISCTKDQTQLLVYVDTLEALGDLRGAELELLQAGRSLSSVELQGPLTLPGSFAVTPSSGELDQPFTLRIRLRAPTNTREVERRFTGFIENQTAFLFICAPAQCPADCQGACDPQGCLQAPAAPSLEDQPGYRCDSIMPPLDAGLFDAGPQDLGSKDLGPTADAGDAGVPDLGPLDAGQEAPWWEENWKHRQSLELVASTSSIQADEPISFMLDHRGLVDAQKSLANGRDVRVVYNNTEVPRRATRAQNWLSPGGTRIFIRSPVAMQQGETVRMHVYYNNSEAPPERETRVPPGRTIAAEVLEEKSLASGESPAVIGTLGIPNAIDDQLWVVVLSWRQKTSGMQALSSGSGLVSIAVTGDFQPNLSGLAYGQAPDQWKAMSTWLTVSGGNIPKQIQVNLSPPAVVGAADTRAHIDSLRMLAFMVPRILDADVHQQHNDALVEDEIAPVQASRMTFTPSQTGQYLWMARGLTQQFPDNFASRLTAINEAGDVAQQVDDHFLDSTGFVPLVHFEPRPLSKDVPVGFRLEHDPLGGGARRKAIAQLAFSLDGFEQVSHAANPELALSAAPNSPLEYAFQTPPVPGQELRESVYLNIAQLSYRGGNFNEEVYGELSFGQQVTLRDQMRADQTEDEAVFAFAHSEYNEGGRSMRQTAVPQATQGRQVGLRYSHMIALRYRDVRYMLGLEETAP